MKLKVRAKITGDLTDVMKVRDGVLESVTQKVLENVIKETPYDAESRIHMSNRQPEHLANTWKTEKKDQNTNTIYSEDFRMEMLIDGVPERLAKRPKGMRYWFRRDAKWYTNVRRIPALVPHIIGPRNADMKYKEVLGESVKTGADEGWKLAIRSLE